METAVVNVKVDKSVKKQAQEVAESLGFSLSSLVNAYLRNLVRTKTVHFEQGNTPTPYLEEILARAEKERASKNTVSFDSVQKSLNYLDTLIKQDQDGNRKN